MHWLKMSMLLNISLLLGGFSHRRYPDLMGGISLIPAPAIMVCGLDIVGKGGRNKNEIENYLLSLER